MSESIVVDREGPVAQVQLNRPEKHNAVDRGMFEAFIDVGRSLATDRSLRAVVLTGAGDNFCAGIDVSVFANSGEISPEKLAPRADSDANFFQSAAYVWREMPVPVIAALKGVVFGAGLQIALGADVRIAHADAKLSILEIKWGIVPDMGFTTVLPSLMPLDQALALTWTGRIVNGGEAASLGLVTSLANDPERSALEFAGSVAGRSPDAIRAAKQLMKDAWADRDAELLRMEAEWQLRVLSAPNQREAVKANLERREPTFVDSEL